MPGNMRLLLDGIGNILIGNYMTEAFIGTLTAAQNQKLVAEVSPRVATVHGNLYAKSTIDGGSSVK